MPARKHVLTALRAFFSLGNIRHCISSAGHRLFEHVVWRLAITAEKDVRIHPTASIRNAGNVYVGKNSHINLNCVVWAGETSKIVLGDNLLMGPAVQLHASNHGTVLGTPMTTQSRRFADITIGNDVWLCAGSIITAGVRIADGVIVAANAVVTRDIPEEGVIVGGIPAKVVGRRQND